MKYLFIISLYCIIVSIQLNAQEKYFVAFSDKIGTPYSIDNPEKFLSQKSIERRHRQGIEIKDTDLPVNPYYLYQLKNSGAKVLYSLKWFNGAVVEIIDNQTLESISTLSFVQKIEKVFETGLKSLGIPDEDIFAVYSAPKDSQDFYHYGSSSNQIKMLKGHVLHNKGYRGKGITIGVLDAGFYNVNILAAFDSIRLNNRIIETRDFVNSNSNLYQEHTHGMLVLSVMAGNIPGELIGSAPEAEYVLIRSEDANAEQIIEEYNWVAAAELADSLGVDVINSSLGYYYYDASWQNHSYKDMDGQTTPIALGANFAANTGMIVIVSAGNEATTEWRHIITPADAFGSIAVGAVNSNGDYVSFSSIGPSADGRIKPELVAQGQRTVVQSPSGTIGSADGTSLSAPIISGLAACLWQAFPSLTAKQLIEQMLRSSTSYANPNNFIGYGIPDFSFGTESSAYIKTDKQLKLYPNPTKSEVRFTLPPSISNEYILLLTTLSGEILQKNISTCESPLQIINIPNNYPTGLYILQLISNEGIMVGKIIKHWQ